MAKIEIDEFLKFVRERRTIRNFKTDPVPDDTVEKILEAARWAPSGANAQPWEFIVVKDPQTRLKIATLYADYWRAIYDIEKSRVEDLKHQGFTTLPTGTPGFVNAPVFIVVCADPRTYLATVLIAYLCDGEGGPKATYLKNVANATTLLHLATAACGLASQWVSVDRSWEGKLKSLLGVPHELEIHTIVPIGRPAYKRPGVYRRKLKEIVHHEQYDISRFRSEEDIVAYVRQLRKTSRPNYKRPSGDTWA
ncbi:MAG: nitroreductase family protein [Desulfobacterales bacterium]|nr:nitroreductase family protein [Desulfobacterales bacterium]